MAISKNLYTQGFRKKLGGAVWYQRYGDTVIREKAPKIDNPRTIAQMSQRVKLANVVSFYRANRSWMERLAFETRKRWQTVFNRFTQLNLNANQVPLTKEQVEFSAAIVAPYLVTQGSLPSVTWKENPDGDGIYVSNLYMETAYNIEMTIAQFSQSLLNANPTLRKGMQLSLISMYQNTDGLVPTISVAEWEIVLDPTDSRKMSTVVQDDAFEAADFDSLCVNTANLDCTAFVVVLSETVSGKTQVSTQFVEMVNYAVYNDYTSQGQLDEALESYGHNEQYFLDSRSEGDGFQLPPNYDTSGIEILSLDGVSAGQPFVFNFTEKKTVEIKFNKPVTVLDNMSFSTYDHKPYGGDNPPKATNAVSKSADGLTWNIDLQGVSPRADRRVDCFISTPNHYPTTLRFEIAPNTDNGEGITG